MWDRLSSLLSHNTAPPTITGTGQVGATLTCSPGQWTGSPTSYAYQWERNGTVIPGATNSTYIATSADQNTTIQCLVTATNAGGSASALSNGLTVANAQPPTGTLILSPGQVHDHGSRTRTGPGLRDSAR